jgi:hypothetical protein
MIHHHHDLSIKQQARNKRLYVYVYVTMRVVLLSMVSRGLSLPGIKRRLTSMGHLSKIWDHLHWTYLCVQNVF